jgi:hypothetical protein
MLYLLKPKPMIFCYNICFYDGLRDLKYDLWKWEWDLWWAKDFMKCLLIYESDKFYSMSMIMYKEIKEPKLLPELKLPP